MTKQAASPKQKKTQKAPRVTKRDLWLKYYLDDSNPSTFLNKTESARAAGYKTKNDEYLRHIGCQNSTKLAEKINNWLDEAGLSESALKLKLISLLEGKETRFQTLKGKIGQLKPGVEIIAETSQEKLNNKGDAYTETESLIGIEVENLELQRRSLDMAFKVQGSYAAEKHDHTVKGQVKHTHEQALSRALEQKAKMMESSGNG